MAGHTKFRDLDHKEVAVAADTNEHGEEVIRVVQVIGEITKSKDYKGSSVSHLAFGMIEEHCALGGFGTFSFPNEYGAVTTVEVNRKEQ